MSEFKIPEDAKLIVPGFVVGALIILALAGVAAVMGLRTGFQGLWPDVGF